MKCYSIHLLKSSGDWLYRLEASDELGDVTKSQKVGIYKDMECLAFTILEDITKDIYNSSKLAFRFSQFIERHCCPLIINTREVLTWLCDQTSVSI